MRPNIVQRVADRRVADLAGLIILCGPDCRPVRNLKCEDIGCRQRAPVQRLRSFKRHAARSAVAVRHNQRIRLTRLRFSNVLSTIVLAAGVGNRPPGHGLIYGVVGCDKANFFNIIFVFNACVLRTVNEKVIDRESPVSVTFTQTNVFFCSVRINVTGVKAVTGRILIHIFHFRRCTAGNLHQFQQSSLCTLVAAGSPLFLDLDRPLGNESICQRAALSAHGEAVELIKFTGIFFDTILQSALSGKSKDSLPSIPRIQLNFPCKSPCCIGIIGTICICTVVQSYFDRAKQAGKCIVGSNGIAVFIFPDLGNRKFSGMVLNFGVDETCSVRCGILPEAPPVCGHINRIIPVVSTVINAKFLEIVPVLNQLIVIVTVER